MTAAGRTHAGALHDEGDVVLGQDLDAVAGGTVEQAEARRPEAHLPAGLLAGGIEHGPPARCEAGRGLQQQGRLPDAWLAADEHQGARDEAAAQDPVELSQTHRKARHVLVGQGRQWNGLRDTTCADAGSGSRRDVADDRLHEGVPGPAGPALALPAKEGLAAGLTDVAALGPRHGC